jgi:serine/threonine protein kinase
MTPELYEQVCRICYDSLQIEVDRRSSFLDQACAGDALLRREVEAMLAYEGQAESFLDTPALLIAANHAAGLLAESFVPGITLDGRYLIDKELGHGGICAVLLARDRKLHDTPVVIKVLLKSWQQSSRNAWLEKKFKEEIAALARIDHPGVVRALDVGQLPDGRSYLVMQYVDGESLRSMMVPEGMELERMAKLIRQMGQALAAAHRQGVIHRDLKPENIMLQSMDDEEYVKLIDFGIATVYEVTDAAADTRTTEVVGTRSYVAPEQLRGKPVAASDIYALGVIAYEMATGQRPFDSESIFRLYELQRAGVKVKPCELRSTLSETAQSIILKALSFSPEDRYANAKDFADSLADALTGGGSCMPPPPRVFANRRGWLLICALTTVAVIGFLALWSLGISNVADLGQDRTAPVAASERHLSYSMEGRRDPRRNPRAQPFATFDNFIFSAGDEIRFYINSPQSGSLYVINEGPTQTDGLPNFNVLFPDAETDGGLPTIRAGQTVQIPRSSGNEQQDWFVFDQEEGIEKIWLVWSERVVPELEAVKGWANPKDHGTVRDPKQRAALSHYLAALSTIKIEVERDEMSKRTKLKGKGETLVWGMKLEHH